MLLAGRLHSSTTSQFYFRQWKYMFTKNQTSLFLSLFLLVELVIMTHFIKYQKQENCLLPRVVDCIKIKLNAFNSYLKTALNFDVGETHKKYWKKWKYKSLGLYVQLALNVIVLTTGLILDLINGALRTWFMPETFHSIPNNKPVFSKNQNQKNIQIHISSLK